LAEKRRPQQTPGEAVSNYDPTDDFTLPACLYTDAVIFVEKARRAQARSKPLEDVDRYLRAALLAGFAFFEARINQAAFGHASFHEVFLGQLERDVLEEKETTIDDRGMVLRKTKFYPLEARFLFITMFLSGRQFDTSTVLWSEFIEAKKLRDEWTHPKPPFDTWGLTLPKVEKAVRTLIEMLAELSRLMGLEPYHPSMPPYETAAEVLKADVLDDA
jgi:hypothetical protein